MYSQTRLNGLHWDLIMSMTYPCFMLYVVNNLPKVAVLTNAVQCSPLCQDKWISEYDTEVGLTVLIFCRLCRVRG